MKLIKLVLLTFGFAVLASCSKQNIPATDDQEMLSATEGLMAKKDESPSLARGKKGGGDPTTSAYSTYTIPAGSHYCDQSTLASVKTSEMKFMVRFNSSAMYTTLNPGNQADINKLWGFSEGYNNQYNSARFGWAWYNNALRLYGYVYNKGVRSHAEVAAIPIGAEVTCSIKVSGSSYIFTANGTSVILSRGLSTTSASGLQQYPYFGGDETAPHLISIELKSL